MSTRLQDRWVVEVEELVRVEQDLAEIIHCLAEGIVGFGYLVVRAVPLEL